MSRSKILHVHQQRIRGNISAAPADRLPPVIIIDGKARAYGSTVAIDGPCRIVYSPDKPLSCGARLWIETDAGVEVIS